MGTQSVRSVASIGIMAAHTLEQRIQEVKSARIWYRRAHHDYTNALASSCWVIVLSMPLGLEPARQRNSPGLQAEGTSQSRRAPSGGQVDSCRKLKEAQGELNIEVLDAEGEQGPGTWEEKDQ